VATRYKIIHTGNRGSEINALTEKTTPVDADMVGLMDSAASNILKKLSWANIKATLKTYFDTLYGTSGTGAGWISLGTATYEGADDPTYTFSFASDMTATLSAGMKIKLTQSTGGTKYCIITGVGAYSGGKTIITGYFGTDYNLENEAITSPYYSVQKAPFGFPLNPIKWTVSGGNDGSQSNPVNGTYYNIGGNIVLPIGAWKVQSDGDFFIVGTSTDMAIMHVLATVNNGTTGNILTLGDYAGATVTLMNGYLSGNVNVLIASKTTYYRNFVYSRDGGTLLYFGISASHLTAVCAYL